MRKAGKTCLDPLWFTLTIEWICTFHWLCSDKTEFGQKRDCILNTIESYVEILIVRRTLKSCHLFDIGLVSHGYSGMICLIGTWENPHQILRKTSVQEVPVVL